MKFTQDNTLLSIKKINIYKLNIIMETWSFDKTPLFHAKFCSLSKTKDGKVIAEVERNDGIKDTYISK